MDKPEDFQNFIRDYILTYSQKSITYIEFRLHFEQYVTKNYNATRSAEVLQQIDWDAWITQGGANPPAWKISFATTEAKSFEDLADAYIAKNGDGRPDNWDLYVNETNPNLKVIFLNRLIARQNELSINLMIQIDKDYNCTWDKNPEIGQRWLPLAIAMGYEPAYSSDQSGAHYFVSWQGRMKYINPVYLALVRNGRRDLAYRWFKEFQGFYHPIAVAGLKKIIFASISEEEQALLDRFENSLKSGAIKL